MTRTASRSARAVATRSPTKMRWLLGVAVLLGLIVHTTWAQAQQWAQWTAGTAHSASGIVQTRNVPVSFTFTIDPTDGGVADGGYYMTGVNPGGAAFNNELAFGPNPPSTTRCVRACVRACNVMCEEACTVSRSTSRFRAACKKNPSTSHLTLGTHALSMIRQLCKHAIQNQWRFRCHAAQCWQNLRCNAHLRQRGA